MAVSSVANSITFQTINNTVATVTQKAESNLQSRIAQMNENPTASDLLALQQEVQQWNMFTQIQSTLVKEVSDAMKGVIQKAG